MLNQLPGGTWETIICGICHKPGVYRICFHRKYCSSHCRAIAVGRQNSTNLDYADRMREIALKNGNTPPLHKGPTHWNWKGGIGLHSRGLDGKYKKWRVTILRKYNYTCQICFVRGGRLSAHHIKPWAKYPELRYDLNNGVCWCYKCHMEFHGLNKGGKSAKGN
jgi:hypothetical protein